ncbi:MAG: hypothetical protein J1E80_05165 [Desulfovibrionaceae bacterium]|nr:hypothetical protein [Desulfovibrionaceae bacterium]
MDIKLSDHFTAIRLIRFTLPTMGMLGITSLYSVVDGFFVSNFVGKTAFVAVNLIFPFILIPSTLGSMIGTGGSALVAKTLGEGDPDRANRQFSLLVYFAMVLGISLSLLWLPFLRPAARSLGAEGEVLDACLIYGWILIPGLTPMILQYMFQSFFPLAEKPRLGLWVTIAAGMTNILLDAFLILVCGWGLVGAAIATVAGMVVGALPPLIIFSRPNGSQLRMGRPHCKLHTLVKSCTNGSSECMANVSISLVAMLYNFQLLRLAGENGVAAYGVLMYISFLAIALFCGYGFGAIPIIGYHFGAKNTWELKGIFQKSLLINAIFGLVLTVIGFTASYPLVYVFVGYDPSLLKMAHHACILYSFSFFFAGFNIFASSFFTALNNGLISAGISFARTLAFQVIAVLALPAWLGLDGIWLATTAAETGTLGVSILCFRLMGKTYGYK